MRISADTNDSGYTHDCMHDVEIYLDGVMQNNVVTADEDQGFILRASEDKGGLIVKDGYFVEETLTGRVEIRRG